MDRAEDRHFEGRKATISNVPIRWVERARAALNSYPVRTEFRPGHLLSMIFTHEVPAYRLAEGQLARQSQLWQDWKAQNPRTSTSTMFLICEALVREGLLLSREERHGSVTYTVYIIPGQP